MRYIRTCHESDGSWFTKCPRSFAVAVCFRVAASARAVGSVIVSCRAGCLHTVLLYDATAHFNVLPFHPNDVICIPCLSGSTSGHLFPQSLVLFKMMIRATFQIRREPVLHYIRFQVVRKHSSSHVSAYCKDWLLTCRIDGHKPLSVLCGRFQQTSQLHFSPPLQELHH